MQTGKINPSIRRRTRTQNVSPVIEPHYCVIGRATNLALSVNTPPPT